MINLGLFAQFIILLFVGLVLLSNRRWFIYIRKLLTRTVFDLRNFALLCGLWSELVGDGRIGLEIGPYRLLLFSLEAESLYLLL